MYIHERERGGGGERESRRKQSKSKHSNYPAVGYWACEPESKHLKGAYIGII